VALTLSSATACLHFSVDFSVYSRGVLNQLEGAVKKSGARLIELLRIPEEKREAFRAQFLLPPGGAPMTFSHLKQTARPLEEHLLKLAAANNVRKVPVITQPSAPARASPSQLRQSPRFSVNLEVHFQSESDFVREHASNLSKGGIFLNTKDRPPLNSELGLKIRLPNDQLIQTTARVVHHVEQPPPGGVGLAFNQPDPVFERMLENYLAGLDKK
jgi:uncharacterized protein (TIGR02266 family)